MVNVTEKRETSVEPLKGGSNAVGEDLACPEFICVAQVDDNDNPGKANRCQKYTKGAYFFE